jgi:hypothetical protein
VSTADFHTSDRVKLKRGSGNYQLKVGYRDIAGEVEFVCINSDTLRAAVAFPDRHRLIAVPVEYLQHV